MKGVRSTSRHLILAGRTEPNLSHLSVILCLIDREGHPS